MLASFDKFTASLEKIVKEEWKKISFKKGTQNNVFKCMQGKKRYIECCDVSSLTRKVSNRAATGHCDTVAMCAAIARPRITTVVHCRTVAAIGSIIVAVSGISKSPD